MKNQRPIIWLVTIATFLIVLLLWNEKKRAAETPTTASQMTKIASSAVVTRGSTFQPNASAKIVSGTPVVPPINSEQAMRQELSELNNEDIVFYGKVLDQFSLPVKNAIVAVSIRVNDGSRGGVDRFSLATDADGNFSIGGYKGENLGVWVTKKGYVMATTSTLFIYSYLWPESQRYTPDQTNPTVIKMWKLQGAEPLTDLSKDYKLPFTPAPIVFDLVAKTIVTSGGDLKITVNRPAGEISEHNPQDWGFKIEAVEGGLIKTSGKESAITFNAPENGYQLSDTMTASSNRNGIGGIQQSFFVKSRNGQVYSKLHILFGINDTPDQSMNITFSGVANTNSSRNWEATASQ